MNGDLDRFIHLLREATARLDNPYFALPIDGQDLPVHRERVYAYELYHQLRCIWPEDWGFVLNGEVDKRGHPIIRGNLVQDTKPDLLIHTPGRMDGNLIILEIKSITASGDDIAQDFRKLTAFCRFAGYYLGILLVFGEDGGGFRSVQDKCRQAETLAGPDCDQQLISILWQSAPRQPAVPVPWVNAVA